MNQEFEYSPTVIDNFLIYLRHAVSEKFEYYIYKYIFNVAFSFTMFCSICFIRVDKNVKTCKNCGMSICKLCCCCQ